MEERQDTQQKRGWRRPAEAVQNAVVSLWDCGPQVRYGRRWKRVLCYIIRLSDSYATHQCSLMACACAYTALLSLVPLLVITIAAIGFLMRSPQHALDQVVTAIGHYAPNRALIHDIRELLERIFEDRRLIGLFGLAGLLFAAHQTFLAMQPAMNLVWVVPETRHWTRQRLIALAATLYAPLLVGIDLAASAFFIYLGSRPEAVFSSHATSVLLRLAAVLTPVLVITLLFVLLYQFLPSRAVPWKSAAVGAIVAAVLWEATKVLFGVFLVHVNSYNRLYGSLGGFVAFVVWMYYSMAILLLGAEIAADYETMRHGRREAEARLHSGADLAAASGVPSAVAREEAAMLAASPEVPDGGRQAP